jgi:CspA family cold shock protein
MHTGKVKKVVRDRGFGFIADNDGRELFFHKSGVEGSFEGLNEGQNVEFEVESSPKGPRAIGVKLSEQQEQTLS